MNVTISVFGEQQIARRLENVADRLRDMRPLWRALRYEFYRHEEFQFRGEGRAASGGWDQLAESTVKRRGSAHPILTHTGLLRASLTHPNALGSRWHEGKSEMYVESAVPYGRFHQFGTVNMPQRRPVEFTEDHRRRWVKAVQQYIRYYDKRLEAGEGAPELRPMHLRLSNTGGR